MKHIYHKEDNTMSDQGLLNLIVANQEEIKTDLKDVKSEVKKINGRVTKLENDSEWRMKHFDWIMKLVYVGGGVIAGIAIDIGFNFIKGLI